LLGAGADINARGGDYGSALQAAIYRGHSETMQILLDAHTDINAQGGHYGNALQAAASKENNETVQILLDTHADQSEIELLNDSILLWH
jgi:ankyrin repeat protein